MNVSAAVNNSNISISVWNYNNRTLNTSEFLTVLEQEQLLNASYANQLNLTINMSGMNITFNNTYDQTALMIDINASLNALYGAAAINVTNTSTNLVFYLIFAILAIVMAFIALVYNRTMLSLLAGALFVGLGILLYPLNLILMICCIGIGLYLWARIFIS
jgi:hypothetical protein